MLEHHQDFQIQPRCLCSASPHGQPQPKSLQPRRGLNFFKWVHEIKDNLSLRIVVILKVNIEFKTNKNTKVYLDDVPRRTSRSLHQGGRSAAQASSRKRTPLDPVQKYLNFVLSELFSNQIIKIQAFWYFFSFTLPSANRTNKAKLIFDKEKQVITLTINNTFKEINHCFVKMFFVGSSEQPRNFS